MKLTKRELINTICIDKANLEHIASTGNINGILLIEIERIMDQFKKQESKLNPDWCQHKDTCINKVCIGHPRDCEEDNR
jgi:hypothetical protein